MAQLLVFAEHSSLGSGVLAWRDGAVRKITPFNSAPLPRHAYWSFIPVGEGDWGMVLNHGDARVLVCNEQGKPVLDFPNVEPRRGWWRMEPRGGKGHIALVPYHGASHSLSVLPGDGIATLRPSDQAALDEQAWFPRRAEAASYIPLPSFDDTAINETFYNIEVLTPGSDPQNKRLYLTIENEQTGESALKLGSDPKSTAAQFLLAHVGTGRIVSVDKPFVSSGRGGEERICASGAGELAQREIEMINLSGSRTFVSGDRVALRTEFRFYVSWKKGIRDLAVQAYTPEANETFIIKKVTSEGEVLPGVIKPGDSFALAAGENHLTDDRGAAGRPVYVAGHPNIAGWEIFVLGTPAARLFRIHGKKSGYALAREDARGDFIALQQRFGRGVAQFEIVDRGDGMISLRSHVGPRLAYPVVPAGPVEPGQKIGLRERSDTPGMLFRLQAAPATPWPDTVDLTMEKYRDPAEDTSRAMLGAMFSLGGHAFSHFTGIPGGAAVFTFAVNLISPVKKVSMYDLFTKFRADILRDVTVLIASNAATQAKAALKSAREQYLVTYLNARRQEPGGADAKARANDVAGHYVRALDSIPLVRDSDKISDTEQNRGMVRAGLPVYAVIVAEYINILQEIALINAFKPDLVLPDVWLKTRNQYVTASPGAGVGYEAMDAPLTKAVRVLHRDGKKTLKHGDKVILRSPASANLSAIGGGGGALEAKVPSTQIGDAEIFVIERVAVLPSTLNHPIQSGDPVALKTSNGRYVTAPHDGTRPSASAQTCGPAETFALVIAAPKVTTEPPRLESNLRGTVDALQNLRTFAALRYEDTRDIFELLINARVGGTAIRLDMNYRETPHMNAPSDFYFKVAFRDTLYNMELDRVETITTYKPEPPSAFSDPGHDSRLQWGMDGYREHLRRVYYSFKYRYFHALRPLLTIADETQKMCDQLSKDPLMSTEYSYIARTTPEYKA